MMDNDRSRSNHSNSFITSHSSFLLSFSPVFMSAFISSIMSSSSSSSSVSETATVAPVPSPSPYPIVRTPAEMERIKALREKKRKEAAEAEAMKKPIPEGAKVRQEDQNEKK